MARDLEALADVNYAPADVGAAIASGSFRTMGMVARFREHLRSG
jgi:4-hydroxy-3-polyprenylbenzoate decarboxylase